MTTSFPNQPHAPARRYDWDPMSHAEVKRYRPSQRAAAKQAARDGQARALASGERSAAQLHRENGLLAFPREGLAVDFSGFIASRGR
jgi:hypothetical protein